MDKEIKDQSNFINIYILGTLGNSFYFSDNFSFDMVYVMSHV